jgi:hypothetical protein
MSRDASISREVTNTARTQAKACYCSNHQEDSNSKDARSGKDDNCMTQATSWTKAKTWMVDAG